jgi:hypothetical protein
MTNLQKVIHILITRTGQVAKLKAKVKYLEEHIEELYECIEDMR